ncbi:MAG TPA: helix-turn-helix domain-containing protein [Thermodesulfobacteriota bacterium]|nr:helix-turn-helix domain-containing protein [Thermodesulfobacteriota bacterium]HNU71839.1 helix-turn-helix domain-containing protein [Thermodesulfobacteriota bacterium]
MVAHGLSVTINNGKLREEIKRRDYRHHQIGKLIKKDRVTVTQKLGGRIPWTLEEVSTIAEEFGVPAGLFLQSDGDSLAFCNGALTASTAALKKYPHLKHIIMAANDDDATLLRILTRAFLDALEDESEEIDTSGTTKQESPLTAR